MATRTALLIVFRSIAGIVACLTGLVFLDVLFRFHTAVSRPLALGIILIAFLLTYVFGRIALTGRILR